MKRNLLLAFSFAALSCAVEVPPETPDVGPMTAANAVVVETADLYAEPECSDAYYVMDVLYSKAEPHDMAELTSLEEAIIDRAMKCDRSRNPDRALLRDMLLYEREFNVPESMRGMVLAAACHESGYNPDARGDHKCSGEKRVSHRRFRCEDGKWSKRKSIGILQQRAWWKRSYGIDRHDPRQAAQAWIAHVQRQLKAVREPCGLTSDYQQAELWRVAWVTAIYAPKKQPRCYFKTKEHRHFKRLKRWSKSWQHLISPPEQIASR